MESKNTTGSFFIFFIFPPHVIVIIIVAVQRLRRVPCCRGGLPRERPGSAGGAWAKVLWWVQGARCRATMPVTNKKEEEEEEEEEEKTEKRTGKKPEESKS